MKHSRSYGIFAIGILTGAMLGWFLKPTQNAAPVDTERRAGSAPRPTRTASVKGSRFESEFGAIRDGTFKVDAETSAQDIDQLEALAAALLKDVGDYSNLEGPERQAFTQLLRAMAEANLDRTLAWVDAVSSEKSRAALYRRALQHGARDLPVLDQLERFKEGGFTAKEIGSFAGNLMMGYESMNTETALFLLGHIQPSDGGYSGGHARFAAGFDFGAFADATMEMCRANSNKMPDTYPINFFSEWTRADPQAAADFYFSNCTGKDGQRLPYNDIDKFMTELHANISEADYNNFLTTALNQQLLAENPDTQLINELLWAGLSNPESVSQSLTTIADPTEREKVITNTISRASEECGIGAGDLMQLRGAILLYQNPDERMTGLENYARQLSTRSGDKEGHLMIRNLCGQLSVLGHSEEDLQRIRNAAGQYGK